MPWTETTRRPCQGNSPVSQEVDFCYSSFTEAVEFAGMAVLKVLRACPELFFPSPEYVLRILMLRFVSFTRFGLPWVILFMNCVLPWSGYRWRQQDRPVRGIHS